MNVVHYTLQHRLANNECSPLYTIAQVLGPQNMLSSIDYGTGPQTV